MKQFTWLLVVGALALLPAAAYADTVTITGCPSCFGLSYTLTVNPSGSGYAASLEISGTFTGSTSARFVSAVDFKVSSDVVPPLVLTAAPGGTGGWVTSEYGVNNAGCTANGLGFVCSQDPAVVSLASLNYSGSSFGPIDLVWAWTFNLPDGTSLFAGLDGAHIGAKFNNADGTLDGQIMSDKYAVPEPASMLLLGSGLVGVGFFARRRKK